MSRVTFRPLTPVIGIVAASLLLEACSTGGAGRYPRTRARDGSGGALGMGSAVPPASAGTVAQAPAVERADFLKLQSAFQSAAQSMPSDGTAPSGAFDVVFQRASAFERRFPKSGLLAHVENLKGLSLLLSRRPAQAVVPFRRSIDLASNLPGFPQFVRYNLATAYFELGKLDEASNVLAVLRFDQLDRPNRLKALYLKSRIDFAQGRSVDAARGFLQAARLAPEPPAPETVQALRGALDGALAKVTLTGEVEKLLSEFPDSVLGDELYFKLAQMERSLGNLDRTENHIRELESRFPGSPLRESARGLLGPATAQVDQGPVDARKIGVLLPLKGRFGKFGTRTLQAISLAHGIFTPPLDRTAAPTGRRPIQLVIEDSGEEPADGVRALERLAAEHRVAAVIGPLTGRGIEQVTLRAQELGIPLLSIARYDGLPGDFVFGAGLTLKLQAEEMARYAIQDMGLKRFAIVHPRDKVGQQISQHFWDAIEKQGGEITGIESYEPGETDFRAPVERLTGTYYAAARQREVDALTKIREEKKITRRTRKTEMFFALPPIVEFDAVFIPDEPKVAGQLIPTFAYRDVDRVNFLGTSVWNSTDFADRVGNSGNRAFFLDAFSPTQQSEQVRVFMERYRQTFSQEPTVLEAIAFDAARVLETALQRLPEQTTRVEVRDALRAVRNFPGVTGQMSFRDGLYFRDLKILSVRGGQISEIGQTAR